MLQDTRKLLLHVCTTMTHNRNNIALRAVNPSFSVRSDTDVNYTLPLTEFQQILIQQTAAGKAAHEATAKRRPHRRFTGGFSSNMQSASTGPDQQFFRPGPPSQQGGFNNNNYNNNNFRSSNNRSNNNSTNNSNKKTDPFCQ
ncbi:hypothetical protein [Parasitella parasitica]|uniref:Uncharacterized protein n=1 Tax=Parasitella parasitica TaxID=35722 RepID=A0A0B7NQM2_9FUNG|nr:hypothetical protein [Parasitella parasitica]